MQAVLITVHLLVAIALIFVVLLQRSEGGALGMGGGGSGLGGLFSPRGAADTLTRATAILGALFFLTCLALNIISLHGRRETSILDSPLTTTGPPAPAQKPQNPVTPAKRPSVPTP